MARRSKFKDPGLFMTLIIIIYSTIVFAWWPTDIYMAGLSLVAWLMFFGLFLWFIITATYVIWIEKIEKD